MADARLNVVGRPCSDSSGARMPYKLSRYYYFYYFINITTKLKHRMYREYVNAFMWY